MGIWTQVYEILLQVLNLWRSGSEFKVMNSKYELNTISQYYEFNIVTHKSLFLAWIHI